MEKFKFETRAEFTAEASLNNPNLGWLEFVLTDDQPNGNNQGIRKESFSSLIESGMYMPIKVGQEEVRLDHSEAEPLGPITVLEEEGNKVVGKAVVWKRERPEMYAALKEMKEKGENISLSWELAYTKSEEEDGVEWFLNPVLTAATIVGNPAYGDRTPVVSVASLPNLEKFIEKIEQGEVDEEELEALSTAIRAATSTQEEEEGGEAKENGENTMELEELKEELADLRKLNEKLETDLETIKSERDALAEFKEQKEEEERVANLLEERLEVLEEAGFEFEDDEVEAKADLWVNMSEEVFNEMVENMKKVRSTASASMNNVPDLSGDEPSDALETVRAGLEELKKKKERGG